jgi:HdeA/HdeB family
MWIKRNLMAVFTIVILAGFSSASAQDARERTIEQYECRDVMRDSGSNRDVAIAFLHGFLLGKSGNSKFNLDVLQKKTDAFIEQCLLNPREKAVDVMLTVMK